MKLFKKEEIHIDGAFVIYESKEEQEVFSLDELLEVRYQWDLGVGFSHWLILSTKDKKILVDPRIFGVDKMLSELHRRLKDFPKIDHLETLIEEDLAWDNVVVWRRT